jgi:hypothetical protein
MAMLDVERKVYKLHNVKLVMAREKFEVYTVLVFLVPCASLLEQKNVICVLNSSTPE